MMCSLGLVNFGTRCR